MPPASGGERTLDHEWSSEFGKLRVSARGTSRSIRRRAVAYCSRGRPFRFGRQQGRERNVTRDRRPNGCQIGPLQIERADLHRQRGEYGSDPSIVMLLPCRYSAREALQAGPAKLVSCSAHGLSELIQLLRSDDRSSKNKRLAKQPALW